MLRQFGVALAVLASWGAFTQRQSPCVFALVAVAAAALVATVCAPQALRVLFVGASAVTYPLGWLVQRVLLGCFYFMVFTPAALLLRGYRRMRGQTEGVHGWETVDATRSTDDYFDHAGHASDVLRFVARTNKWWLLPLLLALLIFSALALLGGTGVAPFIYPLF